MDDPTDKPGERKPNYSTRFQKGNPGGPGRPKGARSKLKESFLAVMLKDFEEHGLDAVQKAREADPASYLRTIASILPKEVTGEDGEPLFSGITVQFVRPPAAS